MSAAKGSIAIGIAIEVSRTLTGQVSLTARDEATWLLGTRIVVSPEVAFELAAELIQAARNARIVDAERTGRHMFGVSEVKEVA